MCIFAAVSASAKLQNVYHLQAYSANKNIIKNKKTYLRVNFYINVFMANLMNPFSL